MVWALDGSGGGDRTGTVLVARLSRWPRRPLSPLTLFLLCSPCLGQPGHGLVAAAAEAAAAEAVAQATPRRRYFREQM